MLVRRLVRDIVSAAHMKRYRVRIAGDLVEQLLCLLPKGPREGEVRADLRLEVLEVLLALKVSVEIDVAHPVQHRRMKSHIRPPEDLLIEKAPGPRKQA